MTTTGDLTVSGSAVDLTTNSGGDLTFGSTSVSGDLNSNTGGMVKTLPCAVLQVDGDASLKTPNGTFTIDGSGNVVTPVTDITTNNQVVDFVLRASTYVVNVFDTIKSAGDGALTTDSGLQILPTATSSVSLQDFRYVVPETFSILDSGVLLPEKSTAGSPGLSGESLRYFTGDSTIRENTRFRYIYPRVNLGVAYYVGSQVSVYSDALEHKN